MKKYLVIALSILFILVIGIFFIQSLLKSKPESSSITSPFPTAVQVDKRYSSSLSSSSSSNSSFVEEDREQKARKEAEQKTEQEAQQTLKEVQSSLSLPLEEEDFILDYAPNLSKLVVTRKTPQADASFAKWAKTQGYPRLVDNIKTTIISDKTMEEVQTPYVTKSPEQGLTDLFTLFGLMIRPPVMTTTGEPTPPPPSDCRELDEKLAEYNIHYPNPYLDTPRTNNQIFDFTGTKNYSIPYRNPNCTVDETVIKKAYEKMRTFYPTYFTSTKLLDHWELVQEKAKQYNFNPLFVISLWIEESAAGGATKATQFGCDYLRNANGSWTTLRGKPSDICTQMQCLFVVGSANPKDFVEFSCSYQYGFSQCIPSGGIRCQSCQKNPTFIKTINFWYEFLSQDQRAECKAKYCRGEGCSFAN